MPPQPIFDVRTIDQTRLLADRGQIQQINPQRHEFQQLDGVFFADHDNNVIVGFRDVGADEFWVRGHIPGRPVFPGVLIIEAAAQLFSYYVMTHEDARGKFLGFGGADQVKFRGQVVPGDRLILMGRMVEWRRGRKYVGHIQGFVGNRMVYEGLITGMFM